MHVLKIIFDPVHLAFEVMVLLSSIRLFWIENFACTNFLTTMPWNIWGPLGFKTIILFPRIFCREWGSPTYSFLYYKLKLKSRFLFCEYLRYWDHLSSTRRLCSVWKHFCFDIADVALKRLIALLSVKGVILLVGSPKPGSALNTKKVRTSPSGPTEALIASTDICKASSLSISKAFFRSMWYTERKETWYRSKIVVLLADSTGIDLVWIWSISAFAWEVAPIK